MKLFDKIDDEEDEVELSAPEEETFEEESFEEESRLKEEVEETIIGNPDKEPETSSSSTSSPTSSSSSSGNSGSMLPGMSSDANKASSSSSSIDIEDVHRQNEKIIGLLKEIKSEVKNENELL